MCMSATASSAGGNPWDIFCAISKVLCGGAIPPGPVNPSGITSIPMESIHRHAQRSRSPRHRMRRRIRWAQIHITPQGGTLISAPAIGDGKNTVPLSGAIGGVPYALTLIFTLDLPNKQITVELDVTEPINFEHTWTFNLNGFTAIPGGAPGAATASGIELATPFPLTKDASAAAKGVDFLCIIGCGGSEALLPILLQCLPSLIGGTPAYLACLATQAARGRRHRAMHRNQMLPLIHPPITENFSAPGPRETQHHPSSNGQCNESRYVQTEITPLDQTHDFQLHKIVAFERILTRRQKGAFAEILRGSMIQAFNARSITPPPTTAPEQNVVGIGIGEMVSSGRWTGVMAVKIFSATSSR